MLTLLAQACSPDLLSQFLSRFGEVDDAVESARERVIQICAKVARQDRKAVEGLHPLQEIGNFDVRVSVSRIAHLGTLPEQGVRLIEQQDPVELLGRSEDLLESLFGLPDVLVHHTRQVDVEQRNPELPSKSFRGHGLSRPGRPGEEGGDPSASRSARTHGPVVEDSIPETNPAQEMGQLPFYLIGNDDVGEPEGGNHRAGQGSHIRGCRCADLLVAVKQPLAYVLRFEALQRVDGARTVDLIGEVVQPCVTDCGRRHRDVNDAIGGKVHRHARTGDDDHGNETLVKQRDDLTDTVGRDSTSINDHGSARQGGFPKARVDGVSALGGVVRKIVRVQYQCPGMPGHVQAMVRDAHSAGALMRPHTHDG